MSNYWLPILLGIPSGIFSTLFIWLFLVIYQKQVKPWFQELVYRGVEVKGCWQGGAESVDVGSSHNVPHISYNLSIDIQQGHIIKGTFSQQYETAEDGRREGTFIAEGHIIDGVVILTLMPKSRSKSTFGTLLLNVGSASLSLDGAFTYKGAITNKVSTQYIKLGKKP